MRLPPMPTPSEVLKIYGLRARKQLSQNFLLDVKLCDKIVRAAGNLKDCCVCEVGPGPGPITRAILSRDIRKLIVVEKDSRFIPSLKMLREVATSEKMKIVHGDILSYKMERAFSQAEVPCIPWNEGTPNFHILGNLPFSVSTILIIRWLEAIANRSGPFTYGRVPLTLTFQKEVGERLNAKPSHRQRSRLSVMSQTYCDVRWDFTILGKSFIPAPQVLSFTQPVQVNEARIIDEPSPMIITDGFPSRVVFVAERMFVLRSVLQVDVAVVHLKPLAKPLTDVPFKVLEGLVKILFNYRRKTIRYGGKLLFEDPEKTEEFFDQAGVDSSQRPQELTNAEWCRLCETFAAMQPGIIPEVDMKQSKKRSKKFSTCGVGKGVVNMPANEESANAQTANVREDLSECVSSVDSSVNLSSTDLLEMNETVCGERKSTPL